MRKILKQFERSHISFFVICVLGMIYVLSECLGDPDLLWHIKLGEEIVSSGKVSLYDTFSWQKGLIWYQQEWLFDVFIYLISLPMDGCLFELIFILNNALVFFVGYLYSKPKSKILYFIVTFFAFFTIPANHGNRPIEFSTWIVLLVSFIILSSKHLIYKCVCLFLCGVLITNFHAGSIVAVLAMLFMVALADILCVLRKKLHIKVLLPHVACIISFIIGTFICPTGINLYKHMTVNIGSNTTSFISEWGPWKPSLLGGIVIVLIVVSIGYSLYIVEYSQHELRRMFLIGGALFMTLMWGAKGGTVLSFMMCFFGYTYVELFIDGLIGHPKFQREYSYLCFFVIMVAYAILLRGEFRSYFDKMEENLPESICTELQSASQEPDFTVYNDYLAGNYLLWNDVPCFIDSRQTPYTKELSELGSVDDYFNLRLKGFDKIAYDAFFDKYNFAYIWESPGLYLMDYLELRGGYELLIEENGHRLWKRIN